MSDHISADQFDPSRSGTSISFVKLSVQYILLLTQSTAIPINNSKLHVTSNKDKTLKYRISGTFDSDLNLAVWRICLKSPN